MDIQKKYTVRKHISHISKMGEELVIEIENNHIATDTYERENTGTYNVLYCRNITRVITDYIKRYGTTL